MSMNFRRVESLFGHQRHGATGGAAAFTANAVDVDVILHQMREIDRNRTVRKCGETDLAAAVGHVNRMIDGGLGAGAFDHIIRTDPTSERFDDVDCIFFGNIDDTVRPELSADCEAGIAGSGQDDRAFRSGMIVRI